MSLICHTVSHTATFKVVELLNVFVDRVGELHDISFPVVYTILFPLSLFVSLQDTEILFLKQALAVHFAISGLLVSIVYITNHVIEVHSSSLNPIVQIPVHSIFWFGLIVNILFCIVDSLAFVHSHIKFAVIVHVPHAPSFTFSKFTMFQ